MTPNGIASSWRSAIPNNRLGRDGVDDKARRVLGPLVGAQRATEWLEMCHAALEHAPACRKFATAFAAVF